MSDKPVAAGKSSFDLIDKEGTLAIIDIRPDSSFLDMACGIGNYCIEIAKHIGDKGTIYAVDLWAEGIATLDNRISVEGIGNIKTIVADITATLPVEENSIDSCLMATILHDLSKDAQKKAIQEVARFMKPGGMLNIIEFKKIEKGPGPPVRIRMDEQEVDSVVTEYGFTKVAGADIGEFNYLLKYQF